MSDRTVHAITNLGSEIVRYDRAGKWYVEYGTGILFRRKQIGIGGAVQRAVDWGREIHFGRPGGRTFDARVRKARRG